MNSLTRVGFAAALAVCAFGASSQTVLMLYGNIDTEVDTTHKTTGSAGMPTGASAALIFPPGSAGTKARVTQSLSRTNTLGLGGNTEDAPIEGDYHRWTLGPQGLRFYGQWLSMVTRCIASVRLGGMRAVGSASACPKAVRAS